MSAAEARVGCEKMITIPRRERRRMFKQACLIFLWYGYHIQQDLSNREKKKLEVRGIRLEVKNVN